MRFKIRDKNKVNPVRYLNIKCFVTEIVMSKPPLLGSVEGKLCAPLPIRLHVALSNETVGGSVGSGAMVMVVRR